MKDDEVDEKVEFQPRGIYIRREDVRDERYGITPGCRGCEAANRGYSEIHDERCRLRIEKAIEEKEPDRYARAMARIGVQSNPEIKKRESTDEGESGREIQEDKRRTVESQETSGPSQTSDITDTAVPSQQSDLTEWSCPRCKMSNPAIYKYCPHCPNKQDTIAVRNPNMMDTSEQQSIPAKSKRSREEREMTHQAR